MAELSPERALFATRGASSAAFPASWVRLRRLLAHICRVAETKSKILSHSEVARAMEQGLIGALVTCLTTASGRTGGYARRHHAS